MVAVSKMWQWMDRQVVVSHSTLFQGFRDSPVRARIVAMAVRMGNTYQRGPRGLIVKTLWRQKGHLRHLTAPPKRRHCAAARSSRRVRRVVGEQQGADCASPRCVWQCQLGVLPLGTGNDLARVLGWGSACDDDTQLPQILEKLERASTKMLDR